MTLHCKKFLVNLINELFTNKPKDPMNEKRDNLVYNLVRLAEGSFTFSVKEQSDIVTNYLLANGNVFVAKNGWRVIISEHPEIKPKQRIIYLRGSNTNKDGRPDSIYGFKKKEVDEMVKSIHAALEDMVSAAKNWKVRYNILLEKKYILSPYPVFNPLDAFFSNRYITIRI